MPASAPTSPVHTAARRLRGHLVATPVIGDLRLPGFPVAPTVRVKAECLQTSGSAWYRGYLHYLLRSLGRHKGLVLHGEPRAILAQAWAGALHRLPMVAVGPSPPAPIRLQLEALGCEHAGGGAEDQGRATGFHVLPRAADDPDIGLGLATLALELAADLPADVDRVVVADAVLADALVAGFAAAGRACVVDVPAPSPPPESSPPESPPPPEWREAVLHGLRLVPDPAGLDALWQVRAAAAPVCVVL